MRYFGVWDRSLFFLFLVGFHFESIFSTSTYTVLKFERKLNTNDSNSDITITSGNQDIIWAYSDSDPSSTTIAGYHSARDSVSINLLDPDRRYLRRKLHSRNLGTVVDASLYQYSATLESGVFEMYWNISSSSIHVALEVKTTGWVGLGISPDGEMTDSDIIIGWVKDNVSYIQDRFATGKSNPSLDTARGDTNDLINTEVYEETVSSTGAPSNIPTIAPSLIPTQTPSLNPNSTPSVSPAPTLIPTQTPILNPTSTPSASPTAQLNCSNGVEDFSDSYQFQWSINGGVMNGKVVLANEGWVAWGISYNDMMMGSEAIIGIPGEGVHEYNINGYTIGSIVKKSTTEVGNITQSNGQTIMHFTRQIETGISINLQGDNKFLWAFSHSNSFNQHCGNCYGVVDFQFTCSSLDETDFGTDGTNCDSEDGVYTSSLALATNVHFWWDIKGSYLHGKLRWPSTGWGSWAVSTNGKMIGSDAIVGIPDAVVQRYHLSSKSLSGIDRFSEQNLFNTTIRNDGDKTEMTFARPLAKSQSDEVEFPTSGEVYVLWAYDASSQLSYHSEFGSVSIDLATCEAKEVKSSSVLILMHGTLMFVSWGLLIPIGSLLPPFRRTALHKKIQPLGVVIASVGLVLAIAHTSLDSGKHFSGPHSMLGILVMCLAVVQVAVAIVRPSHGENSSPPTKRKVWEFFHRSLGWILLILGLFVIPTGLFHFHAKNLAIATISWAILIILVCAALALYQKINACRVHETSSRIEVKSTNRG